MSDFHGPSVPAVEGNIDQESVSTTRSRHSSLLGPYHRGPVENWFAACHLVSSARGFVESYPRSLLSSGNGYPIFKVFLPATRRPAQHYRAPSIGDVGFLDINGDFAYGFNIFTSPEDPINFRSVPPNFKPVTPPQPSEITRVPNFYPPGTVLVSKGIHVDRVQDSPLEFIASTCAREGGILVLPDGATREDFAVNGEVLKYIQDNAIVLCQYICLSMNAKTDSVPNGSLYVITGSDKAPSFSAMTIPREVYSAGMDLELQYKHDSPSPDGPWLDFPAGKTSTIRPTQNPGGLYSVFVRGLRISLNNSVWERHVANPSIVQNPYYNILTTPIVGLRSKLIRQKEQRFGASPTDRDKGEKMPFHPSDIIAQMLFEDLPNSQIAIVHDSVWISQVDPVEGDATLPDVTRLIARVFLSHSVRSENNVAFMLDAKDAPTTEASQFRRILAHLYGWSAKWKLERRVNRLLHET